MHVPRGRGTQLVEVLLEGRLVRRGVREAEAGRLLRPALGKRVMARVLQKAW